MDSRFDQLGFIRCAAHTPALTIADPLTNASRIAATLRDDAQAEVTISLFPELCLTGYSAEDLFFSRSLQRRTADALHELAVATAQHTGALIVGAPYPLPDGRLLNCAFVLAGGAVRGVVPKTHLPNYGEFYEHRWFSSGRGIELTVADPRLGELFVSTRQLFAIGGVRFAIEICEDLWAVRPPGAEHALAGAELVLNPSASNDLVAKADYRRDLVRMASAQWLCGYLYAGAGPLESTKDVVFGGHRLAAEAGSLLAEGERFALAAASLRVEFDLERVRSDRQRNKTFAEEPREARYRMIDCGQAPPLRALERVYQRQPFVPDDEAQLDARAEEILAIQSTGLARRVRAVGDARLVIAISGGLDSTLALLVCLEAVRRAELPLTHLHAITMPGLATSEHTLASARALASTAGISLREIDIGAAVAQHFRDIDHDPQRHDVTFENTQARERTQIVFDVANAVGGIVVGTGDLSELALGWCTFNGDHMASYNVNASVPKTLIAYLVRWYARHRASTELAAVLARVLDTPISPELVPGNDAIAQRTEDIVGPYRLHDFFLYHFLRFGSGPLRIAALARRAFADEFSVAEIHRWLGEFFRRFVAQQFKRTTLPPGPKVGSVSLSPRGDWRMPDEASFAVFAEELAELEANEATRTRR